ncbi:MAG: hypothetical protein IJW54_04350 [Clostridia bacterium]|nr:hypothetical protein [Clostridia bacterium]
MDKELTLESKELNQNSDIPCDSIKENEAEEKTALTYSDEATNIEPQSDTENEETAQEVSINEDEIATDTPVNDNGVEESREAEIVIAPKQKKVKKEQKQSSEAEKEDFESTEVGKNSESDEKGENGGEEKPLTKKEQKEMKQRAKDAKLRRNFKKLTIISIVLCSVATISVLISLIVSAINLSSGDNTYEFLRARYHLTMIFTLLFSLVLYIPSVSSAGVCLYDQYKKKKGRELSKKILLWVLAILPLVIALLLIILICAI